jgi:hypothetical protein
MIVPRITQARMQPVRRLDDVDCDRLGFEGPLVLSRREYRFVFGPWRPVDAYVVTHRVRGEMLVCTRRELEALGVSLPST